MVNSDWKVPWTTYGKPTANPPIAPQFEERTALFMTEWVFIVLCVPVVDGFVEPRRADTYHEGGESGKRMGRGEVYKDGWSPLPFELLCSLPSQQFHTPTAHQTKETEISGISVNSYSIFISIPALLLSPRVPPVAVHGNCDEVQFYKNHHVIHIPPTHHNATRWLFRESISQSIPFA